MAEEALSANIPVPGSVPSAVPPETVQSEMGRESGAVAATPTGRRSRDAELRDALREAGFTQSGRRIGNYSRWHWPEADRQRDISLVVPEDPSAPEYAELMLAAIAALQRITRQGARAQQALNRLAYWQFHAEVFDAV